MKRRIQFLLPVCILLALIACSNINNQWDDMDFSAIFCGEDHESAGCKPREEALSAIGRSGARR